MRRCGLWLRRIEDTLMKALLSNHGEANPCAEGAIHVFKKQFTKSMISIKRTDVVSASFQILDLAKASLCHFMTIGPYNSNIYA